MIDITLLGRVSALVDGEPVTGEAGQRRRLALLALLSDPPLRPVSRDRLMLLLWPDSDTESARHLLSAALHVLRKALGPETILSTGEQVELDAARVRVDVAEFEEAARGEDPERALELYGGPFLDGLFISGSPEFEQWQDARRVELATLYATVLERAAEARAAAGRLDDAVQAWRQLAAQDPYGARPVLGLMRALAAIGNRAAALQAARVHAQLLEGEFDASPEPDVLRLAEELRLEPIASRNPPATPASDASDASDAPPTLPAPATAPDTASFGAERGGPSSDASDGANAAVLAAPPPTPAPPRRGGRARWVVALLFMVAAGALFTWAGGRAPAGHILAVIPRAGLGPDSAADYHSYGIAEQIDYHLGRGGQLRVLNTGSSFLYRDSVLDPREIGRRLGADLLVTVSTRMVNGSPRVRVELMRAGDGHRMWDEQYDGDRVELASEDAIAGIMRTLHLTPSSLPAPGQRAATTDARAYDLNQQGRYAWSRRTPESLLQAVDLFQRAIDADPQYAWAYVGLADAYSVLGSYDYGVLAPDSAYPLARAAALRSLELSRNLAPAHAALANVMLNHDWDWAGAEAGFRRAIQLNPGYTPASEWLAYLMIARGRMAEAQDLLRDALEYNPASALVLTDLAHYHYYLQEYDRAHSYLDRAVSVDPAFGRAYLLRALILCMTGSPDHAIELLQPLAAARGADDPILSALLGYAYALNGQRAEAMALIDRLADLQRSRFVPPEYRATIHLGLGDHDRAIDLFEHAFQRRSSAMVFLNVDPMVAPLRGLPRFERLLDAVAGSVRR